MRECGDALWTGYGESMNISLIDQMPSLDAVALLVD